MAISATFELREDGYNVLESALSKSYTVIDLDYTLKRALDKTGRPASMATLDFIKLTIRGTKEALASFHEWIQQPDKMKAGTIKIYDSTGYFAGMAQDFTGEDTANLMDTFNDFATGELEENMDFAMDDASNYGVYDDESDDDDANKGKEDLLEEMSRKELIQYIHDNDISVEVGKDDSDDLIRKKIRYYNSIKDKSLDDLKKEADKKDVTYDSGDTKKQLLQKLVDSKKASSQKEAAKKPAYATADSLKKDTSKTASAVVTKAVKEIGESARSITFEHAYCVSLREHFHGDPNHKGVIDSSYPWILEVGIKPGTLHVTGWNLGGKSGWPVDFTFFNV